MSVMIGDLELVGALADVWRAAVAWAEALDSRNRVSKELYPMRWEEADLEVRGALDVLRRAIEAARSTPSRQTVRDAGESQAPTDWVMGRVAAEVERVDAQHGRRYASLHEAYAVLKEEVEEAWAIIRQKDAERDQDALRAEFIQVAAVAVRAARQLTLDRFLAQPLAHDQRGWEPK